LQQQKSVSLAVPKRNRGDQARARSRAGNAKGPGRPKNGRPERRIAVQDAALEYATRGIRVNAVCPGYIHTPMQKGYDDPEQQAWQEAGEPLRRIVEPE
jgi:NAD(P)-dependent dehydrogenase (short-subunit alcohol dehydrogenase family)